MLSSVRNNEADYFNYLNNEPPVLSPVWMMKSAKNKKIKIDESKKYFPLMILLKRHKESKQVKYNIDLQIIKRIE